MNIRKTFFLAVTTLLLSACEGNRQETAMQESISTFLKKYPQSTLQDIYKGNFQDKFGPAHLLTDRKSVENYIRYELNSTDAMEGDYYEPCGWKGGFYRVNLSVLREGKVSMDDFIDAFMGSATGIDTTMTQTWLDEWQLLQKAVRQVSPELKGFAEDSTRLATLLSEGKYVVHHSRIFNQVYQPHYRIIRKDLFETKILPKLKE